MKLDLKGVASWVSTGLLVGQGVLVTACTQTDSKGEDGVDLPTQCTAPSGDAVELTQIAKPSGVGSGDYTADGPGPRRLLLATSTDGLNFTRTGTVLSDQANTPNMVVDTDGRILIYYTGYDLDPSVSGTANRDAIAVAVSEDQGDTWKYYCTGMSGFAASRPPIGDPDVVQLDDGSYRMYVTNGGSNNTINIYSATSADGLSFAYEGMALNTGTTHYKDSLTAKVGSQWLMYLLRSDTGQMMRATSSDGITFTMGSDADYNISVNGHSEQFILSNWFRTASGLRIFAFAGATSDIRSFTTTDGTTLTPDATVSLGLPLDSATEQSWVKDAAVQQLTDGTYLMAYVSEIPQ